VKLTSILVYVGVTCLATAALTAGAQEPSKKAVAETASAPVSASYEEASAHRLNPVSPIRISKPTRFGIFEEIDLEVIVDSGGNVVSANGTSGPKELFEIAVSEVEGWKYQPFIRNGKPVPAKFTEGIQVLPEEDLPKTHPPFPKVRDWNSVRITLARTGCLGSCPSYSVEIQGNGSVLYTGRGNVVLTGQHRDRISPEAVTELVALFRKTNYLALRDSYQARVTDNPTYTTSLAVDGKTKSVTDYVGEEVGMPHFVKDLEDGIDRIAGTDKWTKGNADTVASLGREGWDFKSPEAAEVLARASHFGDFDFVRDLIASGVPLNGRPRIPFVTNGFEPTALVNAASRSDEQMVRLLLESGAGHDDQAEKDQALAAAALEGNLGLVQLLIQHFANPNSANLHGILERGATVLMAAASSGVKEVVEEILKYSPEINARDERGRTAVFGAAEWRYGDEQRHADRPGVIRILVAAGADLDIQDLNGNTALYETIDVDVARALIAGGASLNIRNDDGETPLMATDAEDVAKLLIDAGADLTIRDKQGHTALDIARQNESKDRIALLESAERERPPE
jgi:ankyrin repeat protein